MAKATREIRMGSEAQDIVTGFKGIVINISESLNGMIQFGIQPQVDKDKKYPDSLCIDSSQCEWTGKGVEDKATPARETTIKLGDEVEDKVSGFSGIATWKNIYLNGCIFFQVEPRHNPDVKQERKTRNISCDRLTVVSEKKVVVAQAEKQQIKPPGGPSRKMERI